MLSATAQCADWPQWRYDSGHQASSPEVLPHELSLVWEREYTAREPVWDDPLNRDLMPYDTLFEPVVMDGILYLCFNDSDKIMAFDVRTGKELWRYYTDGPVRLPPALSDGAVYVVSDDGFMYCLDARSGMLRWRYRGAPGDRRVLGNKRLISTWPARGGPVVADGTVYWAASIWPFMGTFIYALDAATGDVQWVNDGTGADWMLQPHNAPSFAGVAPQGSFAVSGDRLMVPGGRSVPACFDADTGEFSYYRLVENAKSGGSFVSVGDGVFFNHFREKVTTLYDLHTGDILVPRISFSAADGSAISGNTGCYPVMDGDTWYFSGAAVTAVSADWIHSELPAWKTSGMKADDLRTQAARTLRESVLWQAGVDASGDLIKAGDCLYAAGPGHITAIETGTASNRIRWTKRIDGSVGRLVVADGMLIAVTVDGRIMAFGDTTDDPARYTVGTAIMESGSGAEETVQSILAMTGIHDGYAVLYNIEDDAIVEELAANSDLHIVSVHPDRGTVARTRRHFDSRGMYGSSVAVHAGDPATFNTPQYFASLTILSIGDDADHAPDAAVLERLYRSTRPYGGAIAVITDDDRIKREFIACAESADLPGLTVGARDPILVLTREGPLPDTAPWTHNLGDVANTGKSDDRKVKLPLGLLWFGGSSNEDVLPRHGHGPAEQVIGGRLIIEGIQSMSARDVYTGRVIWKTDLPDMDPYNMYYDETYKDTPTDTRYNQIHIPGANIRGTNYVATEDRVYIVQTNGREGGSCLVLDAATGERLDTFTIVDTVADSTANPTPARWGYIGVSGDLLIAGYSLVPFSGMAGWKPSGSYENPTTSLQSFDMSASKGLVVMNRVTGEEYWRVGATSGFLHNGIVAGNGLLYALDKLPPHIEARMARRGIASPGDYRLSAFRLETGETVWERSEDAFGSFLSYSREHDYLVQSTRPSRDTVPGEDGTRIIVHRAADGSVVWDAPLEYAEFPLIHNDRLIVARGNVNRHVMLDIHTGQDIMRTDPLSGLDIPVSFERNYGCNYTVASEYLMTFRSGAAGFYDLENMGGLGNFGGFKSGCTNSLVVADGVLNAPDYTRTCSCSYQNQTSLALVHMPDNEYWTFNNFDAPEDIATLGINFGAPGDRLDDRDVLWLDYPSVGGPSPDVAITTEPAEPGRYRIHSSRISGGTDGWIGASGLEGVERLTISLGGDSGQSLMYNVRLYFIEPTGSAPGERMFDVALQDRTVLKKFDVFREAGGPRRMITRDFTDIQAAGTIELRFTSARGSDKSPVISGIMVERID